MMKNLLSILFALLLTPLFAMGQYYFDAQPSSFEDCCIAIEAGSNDGSTDWWVEVDGVTYGPGDENFFGDFLHCPEGGNGAYTVNFLTSHGICWTEVVVLEGCNDASCDDCNITPPIIDVAKDGCTVVLCTHGESNSCGTADYQWEMGDGNTINDNIAIHQYMENGTFTACVTYTVTSPSGESCSEVVCADVEITGCDDCCGLSLVLGTPMHSPYDPCTAFVPVIANANPLCTYETTYQTDAENNNGFLTFNGPGPHPVCVTITSGDCSLTECTEVSTPECPITEPVGPVKPDKGSIKNPGSISSVSVFSGPGKTDNNIEQLDNQAFNVYPNPARDFINIDLPTNKKYPVEIIEVIDVNGSIILSQDATQNHQVTIDISTLPLGLYFVQTSNAIGKSQLQRFSKIQ